MRFHGIALLTSTAILGACGGEKAPAGDTGAPANATTPAATTTPTTDSAATAAPAAGAAATPAAGAAAAAPATGKTHEVKMTGDATGYKFEPANLTVKQGDAIKFIMVSGGPHNVAFQNVTDAAAKAQLDANMPGQKLGEPVRSEKLAADRSGEKVLRWLRGLLLPLRRPARPTRSR